MDDTEITNNEYRQFVYWVRDSIVARTYGQEPYMITDDQGNMRIDWTSASDIDYEDEELVNSISSMYYPDAEQLGFTKSMDPTKFIYEYKRFDINEAAKNLHMKIEWKGKGVNEVGLFEGKNIIEIDPRYFRPTEVENLIGDSSKARKKLGWSPKISFEQLVKEMVYEDLKLAKNNKYSNY
jgi:nucleoside-diphosphate-sugar epimerase